MAHELFGEADFVGDLGGSEAGGVGIAEEKLSAVVEGVPLFLVRRWRCRRGRGRELIGLTSSGHESEDAGLLRGIPCGVGEESAAHGPDQDAGSLSGGVPGCCWRVVRMSMLFLSSADSHLKLATYSAMRLRFSARSRRRASRVSVNLMVVMDGFDGLLEADGDEQAEDDGGDVDEEVSPGVGGVFGGWTSSMGLLG